MQGKALMLIARKVKTHQSLQLNLFIFIEPTKSTCTNFNKTPRHVLFYLFIYFCKYDLEDAFIFLIFQHAGQTKWQENNGTNIVPLSQELGA